MLPASAVVEWELPVFVCMYFCFLVYGKYFPQYIYFQTHVVKRALDKTVGREVTMHMSYARLFHQFLLKVVICVVLCWHSLFTIVLEWMHNGMDHIKIAEGLLLL
jgi:hypothetical protein